MKTVRAFETIGSTSDEAKRLAASPDTELPLLVTTNTQTAGRGRGENRWWSDAGSLTFSLAFESASFGLRRDHESRIALAAAVAIVRACEPIAPLGIRWPNDVECRGRKLGGLLPESIVTPIGPRFVLGIGLNVTTDLGAATEDVRRMATSLGEQCLRPLDKHLVLSAMLDRLEEALAELADDEPGLARAWSGLDLLRGQPVRLRLGEAVVEGTGVGIAADGSLILKTATGDRSFHAGQVLRS